MNKLANKNYIDVTKEWLKIAHPNTYKVKELNFFEYNNKKYFVDNKKVVLDYSQEEAEVANFLAKSFSEEVYLLPRINIPTGIKTADYIFKGEKYDLKRINGLSKRVVDNALKNKKSQSHNFILKIESNISNSEIIDQALRIYKTYHREWIDTIIIIKNNKLLKVFKRKK